MINLEIHVIETVEINAIETGSDEVVVEGQNSVEIAVVGVGVKGDDGREVEFQKSATHIQWRYVGGSTWSNLVEISELKGEDGDPLQIVNDLISNDTNKALSAYQGKVLKGYIDTINALLASNDTTLDQLQEIVNYIKINRAALESLSIGAIAGLGDALNSKLDGTLHAGRVPFASGAKTLEDIQGFEFDKNSKFLHLYGSLGSEKVTNGAFTGNASGWTLGTGWTYSANKMTKNSNGTGTLSQNVSAVFSEFYAVTFTVTNLTVGNFVLQIGGVTVATISANGTYTYKVRALSTGNIIFTPSNTSRFEIDDISVKKFQDGDMIVGGKGYFGDKVTVQRNASNYYPGDVDFSEFHNTSGVYSHHVNRFGSTIKSALSAFSDGSYQINMTSVNGLMLTYGSTITSTSAYAYMGVAGLLMTGYGKFSGKVSAGYMYSNLPSKLDVWGSEMKMAKRIDTQGYTLDDDCLHLLDTSNATGCTGTPSTNCSSYGSNESNCNAHAEVGCTFSIQYYCSSFNGDPGTCGSMGCSADTASCSGAGDQMSCEGQDDSYGGSCYWSSSSQDCGGFDETTCNNNSGNGCSVNNSSCSWYQYNCSQHGDASSCGEHVSDGCTTNYFNCADYNYNESGCNEQSANGCTYNSENSMCEGGIFTSCTGGNASCSGGGNCSSQGDQMSCESTYYYNGCSGSIPYYTCEGSYYTGNCSGGYYGICQGNAGCASVPENHCNNTYNPGCAWTNTLNIYLPNSNTFYQTFGSLDRAMTRIYQDAVIGGGSVVMMTKGADTFEDGSTSKSLANNTKHQYFFFGVKGNCTDFNGNEGQCGSNSGCSPQYTYDEMTMTNTYTGCVGEYQKYKRWYTATL